MKRQTVVSNSLMMLITVWCSIMMCTCTTVAYCHMHPVVTSSWTAVCYKSRKVEATLDFEKRENASLEALDFDFPSVT